MLPDLPTTATLPASVTPVVPPSRAFGGFTGEAFDVLGALRREPNVTAYRREKARIEAHVTGPFRRYRDDLVVSLVLPNRLPFETERNVFSRLLKNDYGAGGCHSHLWMSVYRHGRKRLTDPQLSHSIDPDGHSVGLYVGDHYGDYFARFKDRVAAEPSAFAAILRGIVEAPAVRDGEPAEAASNPEASEDDVPAAATSELPPFSAYAYTRARGVETRHDLAAPDADLGVLARATGVWVRTRWPRESVVAMGPHLVDTAVRAVARLWPLYVWQCAAADR